MLALSDPRGGIGLFEMLESGGVDRSWFSTLNLRQRTLTLQRLTTLTATGLPSAVTALATYSSTIYAVSGTGVYSYDNATPAWSASLHTLLGGATDALTVRLLGTVYLFIAFGTGYAYYDGISWTNDTEDMRYLCWWDNRLWGIDDTGLLRFTTWATAGSWTDDAQLPLDNNSVTALFTGMDANGNSILYAMSKEGLWAHDAADAQWVKTRLELPRHPDNGRGTRRWRDNSYIPAGQAIYKYADGSSTAVISVMGPDRDDGLPSDRRGTIRHLEGSQNELIAAVDGTAAPNATLPDLYVSWQAAVVPGPNVGYSTILGWDEKGWQTLWPGASTDEAVAALHVSTAYDEYRVWWAVGTAVYWLELPRDIVNPSQTDDLAYAPTGTHTTPWFSAGQIEVDKLGLLLCLDLSDITSSETVTLSYGLDRAETWETLEVFNKTETNHVHRMVLPSEAKPEGLPFDWVRFKLDVARGTTTTLSPKIHALTLTFRKKLAVRRGWQMLLNVPPGGYQGRTASELRAAIRKAVASTTLVRFTYRPSGPGDDEALDTYVDVKGATELEATGYDYSGSVRLQLVEFGS